MARRLVLLVVLLVWPSLARADAVDDYVTRWLAEFKVPGVAIAIVQNDRVIKMQGYGFANREGRTPATADTVFKIGSVSKQFFATAIMLLVRDTHVGLDDPISRYFDDLPSTWQRITVRQLLSHTAGLPRESPAFDGTRNVPDIDIIRGAYLSPLLAPPGDTYSYSNLGYYVLAEIISRVTRKPWAEYLAEAVFTPGGIGPLFTTGTGRVNGRARGYSGNDNSDIAIEWAAVRPSGAFMMSIRKLVTWDEVLRTNTLLSAAERQQMVTAVTLNDGSEAAYGFGWHVERFNGHPYIWHGGGLPGFSSSFARFPDDRLTIIALSNGDDSDIGALIANLALMYLPK